MSRALASAAGLAPSSQPGEAGAEWRAEIWQRMEDAGLGQQAAEGGQGYGNDRWLRHVGFCPGWRHGSHPSASSEMPDPGTQPPGSLHRRINCALIYGQRCLCWEEAGTPTARAGTPP